LLEQAAIAWKRDSITMRETASDISKVAVVKLRDEPRRDPHVRQRDDPVTEN
jgi:hypothetical protein